MDTIKLVKKCENFPLAPILNFHINLIHFQKNIEFVAWSISTSKDIVDSNPNFLEDDLEFLESFDTDEADERFDEIGIVLYNQLYISLFSFFETFINDTIIMLFDLYEKDLSNCKLSTIAHSITTQVEKRKGKLMGSTIPQKMKFIQNISGLDKKEFDKLNNKIRKHQDQRNKIAHHRGNIVGDRENLKIVVNAKAKNKIAFDKFGLENAQKELYECAFIINNALVKNHDNFRSKN